MIKLTVLLDVDYTILDTGAIWTLVHEIIEANYGAGAGTDFDKSCGEVFKEKGFYDWKDVAMRFAGLRQSEDYASVLGAFLEIPFRDFLRKGAEGLIDFLSKNTNLIIFSDGDDIFQKTKIQKLDLAEKSKEVIISRAKTNLLRDGLFKKYEGPFIIIDDKPEIIETAKEVNEQVKTIWMKFGPHAQGLETVGADFETADLLKVQEYIRDLIRAKN